MLRPAVSQMSALPNGDAGDSLALDKQMREKLRAAGWGESKPPGGQDELLR